ncbi:hypothetical protein GMOD_00009411 [Pyrenophora seminiperda CCB06]|uniref:Uncharacterized protein n=1 Tax=Pyrenophora seminiperda CCB06 TaxID=1302712 RepID=A0A3M7MH39_9PLEO|nr:hypothetical protein GMOD_00009411 [Pyrenophora seminiperda CCB06]
MRNSGVDGPDGGGIGNMDSLPGKLSLTERLHGCAGKAYEVRIGSGLRLRQRATCACHKFKPLSEHRERRVAAVGVGEDM